MKVPELEPCPYCHCLTDRGACALVAETEAAVAIVNPTQYERGGMLNFPLEHRETVLDVGDEEVAAVHVLAKRLALACVRGLGAAGVNVFQNNGIKANQTVPHYHVHVVPRYESSDPRANFRGRDFAATPLEQLRQVADEIRAALAVTT